MKRFCSSCGEAIEFDDTKEFMFCSYCGTKILNSGKNYSGDISSTDAYSHENVLKNTNCPCCGAPIGSFDAKCKACGIELNRKNHASACQELCKRLEDIEASKPKESLLSLVSGFANKVSDTYKLNQTDQRKVELITNFIIPNSKSELLEFLFLAQAKIKACQDISESTDDQYTSYAQDELENAWKAKLDQAISKGRIILENDSEFKSIDKNYSMKKNEEDGLCRYCGGKFKGFINKVCVSCGRAKDY